MNIMIRLTNSQFDEVDPSKSYVIAGWERLCITYPLKVKA